MIHNQWGRGEKIERTRITGSSNTQEKKICSPRVFLERTWGAIYHLCHRIFISFSGFQRNCWSTSSLYLSLPTLARNNRYNKCMSCYNHLLSVRAFILKRQTLQGKLGRSFREMSILMQNLEWEKRTFNFLWSCTASANTYEFRCEPMSNHSYSVIHSPNKTCIIVASIPFQSIQTQSLQSQQSVKKKITPANSFSLSYFFNLFPYLTKNANANNNNAHQGIKPWFKQRK